ncbi:MAG: cereblon family protein [Pseudomonadota bacterium]
MITNSRAAIEVQGSHAHHVFNPAGVLFEIGCFAQAPGCSPVGSPSTEFTWFAGHSWRIVVCASCGQHLGWMFTREAVFFGLISNRLSD